MPETNASGRQGSEKGRRNGLRLYWLAGLCLIAIVIACGYWWLFLRNRVSTDNAYVVADIAAISGRVPGTISKIRIDNDDFVGQGDLLIELDPRDYRTEMERQRAVLARIDAEIEQAEVSVRLTDFRTKAQVEAAEAALQGAKERKIERNHHLEELEQNYKGAMADLSHFKRDYERYSNLLEERAGSEQQRDRASTAFKKAKARAEAIQAQIAGAKASLAAVLQEIDQAEANLQSSKADRLQVEVETKKLAALKSRRTEAQAQLTAAELNLSYCTIEAPISGYIAQKRIQVGERVQPGQPLLAVVPLQQAYVQANFKETELEDVRLGQPVEIEADIYPGHTYSGKVAGIRAGTGAAFSLLPPENATGNWIKVVQRVPVKIHLDSPPPSEYPLRVGLSLDVTVLTKDKSGARLVERHQPRQISQVGQQ